MLSLTAEKKETVRKLQEAVGRSAARLRIIKNVNKKESIGELHSRLRIPQPTISKAIARFEAYGLVKLIGKKGKSEVYDKTPMLKQIGSIDRWIDVDVVEDEVTDPTESKTIRSRKRVPSSTPCIDSKIESDAEKMSEPFTILYLFENSLRNFIGVVLTQKYGPDWWKQVVTNTNLLKMVEGRKKLEGINKWHVPRGSHEIFYTDLEDLAYFLRKEGGLFGNHLDVDIWDTTIRKIVKLSRNVVDHHNPLPNREIKRLREILEDWKRQLS